MRTRTGAATATAARILGIFNGSGIAGALHNEAELLNEFGFEGHLRIIMAEVVEKIKEEEIIRLNRIQNVKYKAHIYRCKH